MNKKIETVTIRALRSASINKRILEVERLALRMGRHLIADIVARMPTDDRKLDEIFAPVKAAAWTARPGKNLILEDRKQFAR